MNKQKYLETIKLLKEAGDAYASGSELLMTDDLYNFYYNEIKLYEIENPTSIDKNSPTLKIDDDRCTGFDKFTHLIPMISMDKALNLNDLTDWLNSMTSKGISSYVSEYKCDGLALSLHYLDGVLDKSVTRGDGVEGDIVTDNSRVISGVLHNIPLKGAVEIRGEVVWNHVEFDKFQESQKRLNKKLMANPRNGAAGTLKLHDVDEVRSRGLTFIAYSIVQGSIHKLHSMDMQLLKSYGFITSPLTKCNTISSVLDACTNGMESRYTIPYDIDGMVVKVDDKEAYKSLGGTVKYPKYLTAFKFPPEEKPTKLIEVLSYFSQTGIITPVAIFDPIHLAGTSVQKATLHNWARVSDLNICEGATISIRKQGDIIPHVCSVVDVGDSGLPYTHPLNCPVCDYETGFIGSALFCMNPTCEGKKIGNFLKFVSKKGMNIIDVGESILMSLIDAGLIESIKDLYKLTESDLLTIPGVKKKKASNFISSVNNSKGNSLHQLIYGLNIKHCGSSVSKSIANKVKSFSEFLSVTYDDLINLDGIGEEIANSIVDYLQIHSDGLKFFIDNNIAQNEIVAKSTSSSLNGLVFALTGKSDLYTKDTFQKTVESNEGVYESSLKKNVTHLVAPIGVPESIKMKKAKENGVIILTDSEFSLLCEK